MARRWLANKKWASKFGYLIDSFECQFIVVQDICPKMKLPRRLEHSLNIAKRLFAENAALFVFGFPPRVRKVTMYGIHRFGGDVLIDDGDRVERS